MKRRFVETLGRIFPGSSPSASAVTSNPVASKPENVEMYELKRKKRDELFGGLVTRSCDSCDRDRDDNNDDGNHSRDNEDRDNDRHRQHRDHHTTPHHGGNGLDLDAIVDLKESLLTLIDIKADILTKLCLKLKVDINADVNLAANIKALVNGEVGAAVKVWVNADVKAKIGQAVRNRCSHSCSSDSDNDILADITAVVKLDLDKLLVKLDADILADLRLRLIALGIKVKVDVDLALGLDPNAIAGDIASDCNEARPAILADLKVALDIAV
ncbi:hypothetical protein BGX27_003793 [Mortierella sp. AM989]|nr:hypothetical protein BGX27_003793 [Mortierella sp. AM989]